MRDLKSFTPVLTISALERFKQVPIRVVLSGATAWGLHSSGYDLWVGHWLAVAVCVQLFEIWALTPFRTNRPTDNFAVAMAVFATAVMGTTYAVMSVLLWQTGSHVLATLAALTLSGGLMTNVASSIGSRIAFVIGGGPYILALLTLPVLVLISDGLADATMMLCVSLLGIGSIMNVYVRVYSMRKVELLALKEAEDRLDQAQTAMADRAAMAAIVSHELRTPVSAILAGAQIVRDERSDARRQETADLIIDAGRLMTGMLNDLLDHSKMEAGALHMEKRDFELGAFLRESGGFWDAAVVQKGLRLEVSGPGEDALWLLGDPHRLRQIINNLMSNAVKFSSSGVIRLEAKAAAICELQLVTLSVTDQGIGISPEALDCLFTPFAQASSEVARTYGGTGLGLSVSRNLARMMGGDLTVEGAEGEGASFILSVVLQAGRPNQIVEEIKVTTPEIEQRLKILAVDDHEINRRTIALVLHPLGVNLTVACSGQEALLLLEQETFDVVLMDVNMPGLNGNETTRQLRAGRGLNHDVPVIGFSAGTEQKQIQACFSAGMTDWLAKPLEPRKLYEALQRAMSRSLDVAAG